MKCSAIEPARSSESGPSTSILPKSHGALDVVALTRLSVTPPKENGSLKELWTPEALAMKRVKAVSALDISKYEATLTRTSKEKLSGEFTRMCSTPASSSRRLTPHKPREPVWTETSDKLYQYRTKLHEEISKYCEQAVGAIKMNLIYKANLLLRISIFVKDWSSVDVDHTEIIFCGNVGAGQIPLRINFSAFSWSLLRLVNGDYVEEQAP